MNTAKSVCLTVIACGLLIALFSLGVYVGETRVAKQCNDTSMFQVSGAIFRCQLAGYKL